MVIFGHRGAPGYPRHGENTIRSFNKALQQGANGLEMDVRRCQDGTIVVIHDHTIDRTTNGRGRVCDYSYKELKSFNAGDNDCIPRLSDVLDIFGSRCLLNVELKESGLTYDVAHLIRNRGLHSSVLLSAFDHDDNSSFATSSWDELGEVASVVSIALICSRAKLLRLGNEKLVASAIQHRARAIHVEGCKECVALLPIAHAQGLRLNIWTVNDARDIAKLRRLGVDGVFSDFPERGRQPE